MEILEALDIVDRRLIEWLRKGDLAGDGMEALVRARAALNEVESRLIIAKIVDPKDYWQYRERRIRELGKLGSQT